MTTKYKLAGLMLSASLLTISGCSMMMEEEQVAEQAPQRPAISFVLPVDKVHCLAVLTIKNRKGARPIRRKTPVGSVPPDPQIDIGTTATIGSPKTTI